MMNVEAMMSSPVITVELDDSLSVVNEIFLNAKFHHLLVVDNGRLFGIVSDRDFLRVLSPNLGTIAEKQGDAAILNKKVHQIMSRHPVCIEKNESLNKVIDLFLGHNISCIPVVDANNAPVGIVSWRDVLKAIRKKNYTNE